MKIIFHRSFEKDYQKLRMSEKRRLKERIKLFTKDQFDPFLNNHPLLGRYQGYHSVNVGGDLRAIYKTAKEGVFIFVAIGTHSKLYQD